MAKRHTNGGVRKVCDCPRRTWAKCEHPWHFSYKWQGVHHRFSLDRREGKHIDSKTAALALAEQYRIAIRAGTFGESTPIQNMTLRQLADLYVDRYVDVEHKA